MRVKIISIIEIIMNCTFANINHLMLTKFAANLNIKGMHYFFLLTLYFYFYTFLCILEYHNSDQVQFLLCARCKNGLVYVSDYFRVTKS